MSGGSLALDKGQVISNAGAMHLNWERLSLSGYFEALEAHSIANDPKGGNHQPASPEFRDQMRKVFSAEKKKVADHG